MPATQASTIPREQVTGLVLAGGQGTRLGGVDKGLHMLAGKPLVQWCAQRLAPQVGALLVNANRNHDAYAALGYTVIADLPSHLGETYTGPLAGFAAGLAACTTPWLLTVACDTPLFPTDLAQRLATAASTNQSLIAMACTPATEPGNAKAANSAQHTLPQPVFCLLHRSLAASAAQYVASGGRKIRQWTAQQPCTLALFDCPGDETNAFFNANTVQDMAHLQTLLAAKLR